MWKAASVAEAAAEADRRSPLFSDARINAHEEVLEGPEQVSGLPGSTSPWAEVSDQQQETSGLRLPVWDHLRDRTNSAEAGQRLWCRQSRHPADSVRLGRVKGNDDSEQALQLPRHRSRSCAVVCGVCCDAAVETAGNFRQMSRPAAREEEKEEERLLHPDDRCCFVDDSVDEVVEGSLEDEVDDLLEEVMQVLRHRRPRRQSKRVSLYRWRPLRGLDRESPL